MNQNKLSLLLISVGTLLIISAIALMTLVATGTIGGSDGNSSLETVVGFGEFSTPTPGPTPTPSSQFPPGSGAAITRIIIEKAKIDAPIVEKGVNEEGVMQAPDNAVDVAWYNFSAHPGFGGNAVFSAHVDYFPDILGPFHELKKVVPDDDIVVAMENGLEYRYHVISLNIYKIEDLNMGELIWPTTKPPGAEWITLITCGGTFVKTQASGAGEYLERVVVIAQRYQ